MKRARVLFYTDPTGPVEGELTDEHSPKTFSAITSALPIESVAYRWGDEIYFKTPVEVGSENPREVVEKGVIAYWPPGKAICVFWGPTPASLSPGEIRPASPVNVVGRVLGDASVFSRVRDGQWIRLEITST